MKRSLAVALSVVFVVGLVGVVLLWFLVLDREIPTEATVGSVEHRYAQEIEWLRTCGRDFSRLDHPELAVMIEKQRPIFLGGEEFVAAVLERTSGFVHKPWTLHGEWPPNGFTWYYAARSVDSDGDSTRLHVHGGRTYVVYRTTVSEAAHTIEILLA